MIKNTNNQKNGKNHYSSEEQKNLLKKLRSKVDQLDKKIVKLLIQRFRYSVLIGKIKKSAGIDYYSPDRESQKIEEVKKKSSDVLSKSYLVSIYERIIDVSRSLQKETSRLSTQDPNVHSSKIKFKNLLTKKELYLLFSFFLLICLLSYYTFFTSNPIKGQTPVVLLVETGMPFSNVVDSLFTKGIIPSKFNLRLAAFLYGAEKRIKAARYKFEKPISYLDLLDILIEGKGDQLKKIKIYNGIRPLNLAQRLQNERIATGDSILFLIDNKDYIQSLGLDVTSLEGYLLPKEYHFYENSTAREIIEKMYNELTKFFDKEKLEQANRIGFSVHKILTMASIIEGETNYIDEMPRISGVYHNRLRVGMKLQADPTIQYLQKDGYKRLKFSDLKVDSPYNTYKYHGLPPGPINNPGVEAINAALFPEEHGYIFFVADGKGKHRFSKTFAEHQRLAKEYYKWLNSQKKK